MSVILIDTSKPNSLFDVLRCDLYKARAICDALSERLQVADENGIDVEFDPVPLADAANDYINSALGSISYCELHDEKESEVEA